MVAVRAFDVVSIVSLQGLAAYFAPLLNDKCNWAQLARVGDNTPCLYNVNLSNSKFSVSLNFIFSLPVAGMSRYLVVLTHRIV